MATLINVPSAEISEAYERQKAAQERFLERSRRLARETNAVNYASGYFEEGLIPERSDLAEIGLAELIYQHAKIAKEQRRRETPLHREQRIADFVNEASEFIIQGQDLAKNADLKQELLLKYFPHRFGSGKQDITKYDERKIGSTFRSVYFNCKRRIIPNL